MTRNVNESIIHVTQIYEAHLRSCAHGLQAHLRTPTTCTNAPVVGLSKCAHGGCVQMHTPTILNQLKYANDNVKRLGKRVHCRPNHCRWSSGRYTMQSVLTNAFVVDVCKCTSSVCALAHIGHWCLCEMVGLHKCAQRADLCKPTTFMSLVIDTHLLSQAHFSVFRARLHHTPFRFPLFTKRKGSAACLYTVIFDFVPANPLYTWLLCAITHSAFEQTGHTFYRHTGFVTPFSAL